jgi:hypothetical protein
VSFHDAYDAVYLEEFGVPYQSNVYLLKDTNGQVYQATRKYGGWTLTLNFRKPERKEQLESFASVLFAMFSIAFAGAAFVYLFWFIIRNMMG